MSRRELFLERESEEILLIEDNPGDARFIQEMLREIDVISAEEDAESTGGRSLLAHVDRLSAGLERLEEHDVAVVLLDLNLPDSQGLNTLERVVDGDDGPPVVVLTGMRDREVGIEALDRGAQGYLVKDDVNADQLLRTIYHAIERDRYERRLERQRDRLTALNNLTQELLEAETSAEIADRVVESARDGLELASTAIALYDEERGTLESAAVTPDADSIDVASLLDPDGGEAWRAFVEGRTIHVDDAGADSSGATIRDTFVPLGRHGVFLARVHVSDERRAQQDFLLLLAANVRAALDRTAREQALRERDQTLREQNERLERLNRVNDVIRDIDQALVGAASRTEIEEAVCTQLTTAGPYAFAWIGEYDAVDDVVEPRASSGAHNGHLDALSSADDDSSERGPVHRTIETREPQVVDDLLGDPPVPAWRRRALEQGYRSCIALPLTYKETLYGVLEVYSDRTEAFDRLERDVLAELGETVGYAINAVESKKALVSDEFVEVEFVVRDPSVSLLAVTAEVDCRIELESVIATSDGGYRIFLTARGAPCESVVASLNRELAPDEARLVTEDGDECLLECTVDGSSFVGRLVDHGGVPQRFTAEAGEGRVVVALPESADVRTFLGTIKTTYADSEMVARREQVRERTAQGDFLSELDRSLTDRQREVLQTAFESGFFESPRARTGSEIGESLGVSQPTFNKHLRAAQRKLLRLVFQGD